MSDYEIRITINSKTEMGAKSEVLKYKSMYSSEYLMRHIIELINKFFKEESHRCRRSNGNCRRKNQFIRI